MSFNSRAHKGRDAQMMLNFGVSTVSIHAPTRGATSSSFRSLSLGCFNSRAHKGRDNKGKDYVPMLYEFQFTRPQGARPHFVQQPTDVDVVSIHAPTRGATMKKLMLLSVL